MDAIKVLLDHKADVNAKEKLRGTTALMWAAEQGHPAAVKLLIEHGADVTRRPIPTPDTQRTMRRACSSGCQRRARGGARRKDGRGKRHAAAGRGAPGRRRGQPGDAPAADGRRDVDDAAAADLLAFGRDRDQGRRRADRRWYIAAREDCIECAQMLVEAGADVNQMTHYGWTPLLTATQNRHYKLAAYLLDHGANPNIANNGGWTPLYLATDNRNIEGGDYPVREARHGSSRLHQAADGQGRERERPHLRRAIDREGMQRRHHRNAHQLHHAVAYEDGATPFLRAAQSGDVTLMKLLLAHGADPKISTAQT